MAWRWCERFICIVCVHIHLAYSFYNVSHFENNSHTFSEYAKYISDRSMEMRVCNICANSRSKMHTRKIHELFHNTKNHTVHKHTNSFTRSIFLSCFRWLSFYFFSLVFCMSVCTFCCWLLLPHSKCVVHVYVCVWNLNAVLCDDQ